MCIKVVHTTEARMTHLERRGGWWYYRVRMPKDIQSRFQKVELKVSLRSRRYSIAKRLVRLLDHRIEDVFNQLRRNHSVLTDDQIHKLVSDHLKKTLAGAEEDRLSGVGLLGEDSEDGEHGPDPLEGLDPHLTDLKGDLARGKYGAVTHIVEELLSSLIDEYRKENKTGQKWSTKTATEVKAVLKLFVEVVGDRDVAGLNHRVLDHYRDVLLKLPEAVIVALAGHAHEGITMSRYGKSYNVKMLKEGLEKLSYGIENELRRIPRFDATL